MQEKEKEQFSLNENARVENTASENIKPDGRISDNDLFQLKNFYESSKSSATATLVCWCLFILIIPLMVSSIIQLVWCVKCLILRSDDLKQDAILWGILGLLLLPVIPIFIMKNKALAAIKKYDPNFNEKK